MPYGSPQLDMRSFCPQIRLHLDYPLGGPKNCLPLPAWKPALPSPVWSQRAEGGDRDPQFDALGYGTRVGPKKGLHVAFTEFNEFVWGLRVGSLTTEAHKAQLSLGRASCVCLRACVRTRACVCVGVGVGGPAHLRCTSSPTSCVAGPCASESECVVNPGMRRTAQGLPHSPEPPSALWTCSSHPTTGSESSAYSSAANTANVGPICAIGVPGRVKHTTAFGHALVGITVAFRAPPSPLKATLPSDAAAVREGLDGTGTPSTMQFRGPKFLLSCAVYRPLPLAPMCDIPSGCCFFTRPWTRSSLRMLRRVAAFCRPLRPVLPLVSFPRSRSPAVGVLGLCWMWRVVPFARQRPPPPPPRCTTDCKGTGRTQSGYVPENAPIWH